MLQTHWRTVQVAALLIWLGANRTLAAWPEGSVGRLVEMCQSLKLPTNTKMSPAQIMDAIYCRAYLEGYLNGVWSERKRPGGNFEKQEICLPGTNVRDYQFKEAALAVVKELEAVPGMWNEKTQTVPWVVITMKMSCQS